MAARIQIRRDTAAKWITHNPTLSEGELALETDTGKFKIGNGADAWTALVYSANGLETLADGADGDVLTTDGNGNYTFQAPTGGADGDLFIDGGTSFTTMTPNTFEIIDAGGSA